MITRARSYALLLLCFFLSGLAALVYETAWTREFAFVFGTSELAVATVLAAYMGGLASGAAAAGRLAPRITRPVLAYGLLELGIALAALAVPFAISASRLLYVAVFGGRGALPDAGGTATALFYLVSSALILLVPTAMMGATLPLLVRHAVQEEAQIGSRTGMLYAVNTAGAVVGTLVAAFALLPAIGLDATIRAAAAVNGAVFLAAWALARVAPAAPAAPPLRAAAQPAGRAAWILPLICVSGVVSFTYEVFWVRLLSHLVGNGVQAFATMLASFLAGIALGAGIASRFASTPRRGALGFALSQLGIAALSLAAFSVLDRIPGLDDGLVARGLPRQLVDTIACMSTLFPAALCIGATFPFAIRVLARDEEDAGPASARVYAANTLGAIVGSVGAGFFLIPGLRFAGTLAAAVAANLGLAAAAALLLEPRRRAVLAAACAGGVGLALLPVSTPWRMLRASPLSRPGWGRVAYYGVGRSATVMLFDQHLWWQLRSNGLPESGILRPDVWPNHYPLARWLTALPLLARPRTRSLAVVGLGAGTALEVVPPTVQRIDVVELEPEVVAANRSVAARRWRDPLSDPRVHVHTNDARNALLLADSRFDAIVSQPSHPWAGGAAHLYTKEFFELAASRLAPDGVFVQWIGTSFVDEALLRSLLAALADTFAHVRVYQPPPGGGLLFLASPAPLDVEATAGRTIAAFPQDFALLGMHAAEDVTACLLLDDAGVRALAAGAAPNRDGFNRLQSRSARLGSRSLRGRVDALIAPHDPLLGPRPGGEDFLYVLRNLPPERAQRVAEALPEGVDRAVARALVGIARGERGGPRRLLEDALRGAPRHEEARAALLRLSANAIVRGARPETVVEAPLDPAERVVTDGWRATSADDDGAALRALEASLAAIPPRHPLAPDAARLRIEWRLRSGDPKRVREAMELADETLGTRPDPRSLLLRAEAYAAAGEPAAVLETLHLLGERLDRLGTVGAAYARRARELIRDTPRDPELAWLRRRAERVLRRR